MEQFSDLMGKVLKSVRVNDDTIEFFTADGEAYQLYHGQDCCEHVRVEEVVGDPADLENDGPVLLAEEVSSEGAEAPEYAYSYTWTFYKIRTLHGDVTFRWLGESNGYYSEGVDFRRITLSAA